MGALGGAGTHTLRISFLIKLALDLPYYQHNPAPFVAEPIHFSLKSTGQSGAPGETEQQESEAGRHPIWRVFDWQRRLDEDKTLTKVQIGEKEGLSKARIMRTFSLLHLPIDAQDYLTELTAPPRAHQCFQRPPVDGRRHDSRPRTGGGIPANPVERAAIGKFRALLRSVRAYLRGVMGTVAGLAKARRDGTLGEGNTLDPLIDKITGRDQQAAHNAAVMADAEIHRSGFG